MTRYGYTLWSEGHDPRELVRQAVLAEEAGFDFLVMSDHYHPWLPEQTHSGFAWSMLGAVAQATSTIGLATMVTCPIIRYHPAIIAQAAATVGVLSEGRFTLGVGAGERLNEHVVGAGWPPADVRQDMLREALEIFRLLWSGGFQTYRGEHFTVEDARVYDLPDTPIEVFVAAGGEQAAELAASSADGVCITEPEGSIIDAFTGAGGSPSATWGQQPMAWHADRDKGVERALADFRFGVPGWKVMAELPNPVNFAAATETVRPEDITEAVTCGPDPDEHAGGIKGFADAGCENIAVAYVGDDAEGFCRFWTEELRPSL